MDFEEFQSSAPPSESTPVADPAQTTVMLVDDERYFRHFVGQVLRKQGITNILHAHDGVQALEVFRLSKPDFVILDLNMPHMDGVETLHALRQLSPELPIVILTSIADEMTVERCVVEGATFFIRKDVPAQILHAELSQLLQENADEFRHTA